MTKKNIKNSMPLACKRGWREKYCPHDRDGVEEIYAGDEILECIIKPEVTSDNDTSVSTSEYHYECFDNGCTLAGEDINMCAIGDDDSKKMLGELILADIIYHCNLTCSNKAKITVKIESED